LSIHVVAQALLKGGQVSTMMTETAVHDWLTIIRGEYEESPGLHLTRLQVRRLWGLDAATCDTLLEALVAARFLRRTPDDAFVRLDFER
jgi:hypothetical protein